MDIILYTIDCPQCKLLERALDGKGIKYEKCKDLEKMLSLGIKSAPALHVGDTLMTLKEALKWVKEQQ